LKGSAALGVFASAEAVAANSDAWIGFIHSANLRPEWERSFYGGLRSKGWEGDPTQAPTGSNKRVNVARHDMGGRYNSSNYTNISNAVTDLAGLPPTGNPVRSMVSAGGIISAKAAIASLTGSSTPLAVAVGLPNTNSTIGSYSNLEGVYFDDGGTSSSGINDATRLHDLTARYGFSTANQKMICLIYNVNSSMGSGQATAWNSTVNPNALSVDASLGGTNAAMNIETAFAQALRLGAQAVMLSSDPYFTYNLQEIVHIVDRPRYKDLIMCYPLQDYADAARKAGMNHSNFMARGPALSTDFDGQGNATNANAVYYVLGTVVGNRLSNSSSSYSLSPATSTYSGL
jgi:hypothetical protein